MLVVLLEEEDVIAIVERHAFGAYDAGDAGDARLSDGGVVVFVPLAIIEENVEGRLDREGADAGPELWWQIQQAKGFCLLRVSERQCLYLVSV